MEQELEALGEDVTIVVDVESFLESIQLEEYWPAFQAAGWTDMDRLHSMAAEDFEQMAVVKAGHIKKLMRHIVRFHAPPPSLTASGAGRQCQPARCGAHISFCTGAAHWLAHGHTAGKFGCGWHFEGAQKRERGGATGAR